MGFRLGIEEKFGQATEQAAQGSGGMSLEVSKRCADVAPGNTGEQDGAEQG